MNDSTAAPNDLENVLAQLFNELETGGNEVIDDYLKRYPQWASEIQEMVEMHGRMHDGAPDGLKPPPQLLGAFHIVRLIGRGGMGDIFEAYDQRLGRRVAIKTIRHGRISDDARDRFLREQAVLAQLHQTHIVPIYHAGAEGDLQYFVMPFIAGAPLHHLIDAVSKHDVSQLGSKAPSLAELVCTLMPKNKDNPAKSTPADVERQADLSTATYHSAPASLTPSPCHPVTPSPRHPVTLSPRHPVTAATPSPNQTRSLSDAYFRSVAHVMADAAEAIDHAHNAVLDNGRKGILHRDLKPSNIMVDTLGQCWIIDFGLAGLMQSGESETARTPAQQSHEPPVEQAPPLAPDNMLSASPLRALTQAGQIHGTPQYMSPEQHRGQTDARSDVWGLGVTLYELLTLRCPFDGASYAQIAEHIVSSEPPPPRSLVRNLPRDLAAICRMAMHKDSERRYQTPSEFADDLRRWLRTEATRARPAWPLRRLALWGRRNKALAAAVGVLALALAAILGGAFVFQENRTTAARRLAAAAEARENVDRRAALVEQLERLRLTAHSVDEKTGWSDQAWHCVHQAAAIRPDQELRDKAVAVLSGMDAHVVATASERGASAVAFDPTGRRLLLGGTDATKSLPAQPARIWDIGTGRISQRSNLAGPGPVAFNADGVPLQLVADSNHPSHVLLWDVAKQQLLKKFELPAASQPVRELAMTPDGRYVAATTNINERPVVVVWDVQATRPLRMFEAAATAVAVRPDGCQVAVGDRDGRITLWPLPDGAPVELPSASRTEIHCFAFRRDYRRLEAPGPVQGSWLLATGDAGGSVVVWDLSTRTTRSRATGSHYNVYALAFSPLGQTLASAGRLDVKIWDLATGNLVLNLKYGDHMTGLAFSPHGQMLALSCSPDFEDFSAAVWQLQNGRGLKTLRGHDSQIAQVRFSPDGRYVAALSHNWQLAIWDHSADRLLYLFDVPRGSTADNAAVAFSPDGQQLAFCAGDKAKLFDLATGNELKSWPLPQGLVDHLAFDPSGKLLLFRVETPAGKPLEAWNGPPRLPRICCFRDLLGPNPTEPFFKSDFLNQHVYCGAAATDGRYFFAEGLHVDANGSRRLVLAFEGNAGRELWRREKPIRSGAASIALTPSGDELAFGIGAKREGVLADARSGERLDSFEFLPQALSGEAGFWARLSDEAPNPVVLFRRGVEEPLVTLGIDRRISSVVFGFDPLGRHLAWGNADGSVMVCDIEEVRQRLQSIGLGWEK